MRSGFAMSLWCLVVMAACASGWGGMPTSSSPTPAPSPAVSPAPTPTPSPLPSPPRTAALALSCSEVVNGYQCNAALVNEVDGSQRDITGLVTWSTSDPKIATVNTLGFVTALASGEVAIRVSYSGEDQF